MLQGESHVSRSRYVTVYAQLSSSSEGSHKSKTKKTYNSSHCEPGPPVVLSVVSASLLILVFNRGVFKI